MRRAVTARRGWRVSSRAIPMRTNWNARAFLERQTAELGNREGGGPNWRACSSTPTNFSTWIKSDETSIQT